LVVTTVNKLSISQMNLEQTHVVE